MQPTAHDSLHHTLRIIQNKYPLTLHCFMLLFQVGVVVLLLPPWPLW
jgi:hypothetical protein